MNFSNQKMAENMFCEVPRPLFRTLTYMDVLEKLLNVEDNETFFVRICVFICVIMYLSYLVSDKNVDEDEEEDVPTSEEEEVPTSEEEEIEIEDEEIEEEEELLRFETNDIKYDQAANILAFIYSCGLTMPDVEFPLESWSLQNKRIKIKESSFMLKVKKYREDPSENMRILIRMKPSIGQLMEAYRYYSAAEERLKTSGSESSLKTSGSESSLKTSGSESSLKTSGSESSLKTSGSESSLETSGSESSLETSGSESMSNGLN